MKTPMQKEKHRNTRLALSILLLSMTLVVLSVADAKTLGEAFKAVNASVVEIRTVQRSVPQRLGMTPTSIGGLGSGVLISPDRVLTASHVVEVADQIKVLFVDGRERFARIVASEQFADVTLLALSEPIEGIEPAPLGDSNDVEVGDQVFVIGAPYGVSHTFTVGFVSGLHRDEVMGGFNLGEVVQTDAAINAGNSGGPMFNLDGQVIGIVSHILSRSGGFEGLGFAISINTAKALVIEQRSFWSGVQGLLLPPPFAQALNVPQSTGLLVQQVAGASPAARLGLQVGRIPINLDGQTVILGGDIILMVNDIRIDSPDAIREIRTSLRSFKPGDRMVVEILRAGHRERLETTPYIAAVD
ncbi:MAG: trypsin-like peptidase domain-containing protein [Gammaproteobacteria bacterium]